MGCGFDIKKDFLNVDLHEMHGPDLVADCTDLHMLPSSYYEYIIAKDDGLVKSQQLTFVKK